MSKSKVTIKEIAEMAGVSIATVSHVINSNLAIGDRTAEEIKITIGSAYPLEQEEKMEIRGRDLLSGLPKTIEVNSVHVREALSEPVSSIIETIKQTLEATPPELAADVMEYGITLTGGGALLRA